MSQFYSARLVAASCDFIATIQQLPVFYAFELSALVKMNIHASLQNFSRLNVKAKYFGFKSKNSIYQLSPII
jgi:hypothetical protein